MLRKEAAAQAAVEAARQKAEADHSGSEAAASEPSTEKAEAATAEGEE